MSEEEEKIESAEETQSKESPKAEKTEDIQPDNVTDAPSTDEKTSEKKEETAADLLGANIEQVKVRKAKGSKNISTGICFIVATFNNTKVSFSDMSGNIISWSSAGAKGFKGSRKSTPYAAQIAADDAGAKAYEQGLRTLTVQVKGPGSGRETALRSLQSKGFKILSIKDTTPMPHNGARPPKRRRV